MTAQEIRNQIEALIKNPTTIPISEPEFTTLDLQNIFYNQFNKKAQDIITKHKTVSTIHQWNRQIGDSKFTSPEASLLGNLLGKLDIKTFNDLYNSNYVRECSLVYHFGWTVEEDKITEAAIDLVTMFNDLCNSDKVRAVLAPLMSIKLANGKYVVLSYFAIDQVNLSFVQSKYGKCQFQEGGIPQEFK